MERFRKEGEGEGGVWKGLERKGSGMEGRETKEYIKVWEGKKVKGRNIEKFGKEGKGKGYRKV